MRQRRSRGDGEVSEEKEAEGREPDDMYISEVQISSTERKASLDTDQQPSLRPTTEQEVQTDDHTLSGEAALEPEKVSPSNVPALPPDFLLQLRYSDASQPFANTHGLPPSERRFLDVVDIDEGHIGNIDLDSKNTPSRPAVHSVRYSPGE